MNRTRNLSVMAVLAFTVIGCSEQDPTSVDSALLPVQPVTLDLSFPWEQFAANLAVYGGYGTAPELGAGVVAKSYEGKLNAHTLVHFGSYPTSTVVLDSLGSTLTDYDLTFHGGRVVAFFDTLGSSAPGPVTLDLGVLRSSWDVHSANWTMAVDTVGDQQAWGEAGAGPVESLGTAVWDPSRGDSAVFQLDSAQALTWTYPDTTADSTAVVDSTYVLPGARLMLLTPGARLKVRDVALRLDTRSSINADTAIVLTVNRTDLTFVYDPPPDPSKTGIIVGSVPAWRTVMDVAFPKSLSAPTSLCAVVTCPLSLTPSQITYAALVLHAKPVDPAFEPADSFSLDVRPVFDRAALPKAALGASIITSGYGRRIGPDLFAAGGGGEVEVPITEYVQSVLADTTYTAQYRTLALLSAFEPLDIAYASFYGPGSPMAPSLRLVITAGPPVEHP